MNQRSFWKKRAGAAAALACAALYLLAAPAGAKQEHGSYAGSAGTAQPATEAQTEDLLVSVTENGTGGLTVTAEPATEAQTEAVT